MSSSDLVKEVLNQILASTILIKKRFKSIQSPDDFLKNDNVLYLNK